MLLDLKELREVLESELTKDWEYPFKRTDREYDARQALYALNEFESLFRTYCRHPRRRND